MNEVMFIAFTVKFVIVWKEGSMLSYASKQKNYKSILIKHDIDSTKFVFDMW